MKILCHATAHLHPRILAWSLALAAGWKNTVIHFGVSLAKITPSGNYLLMV
jgi:hypothetical protein